MTALDIAQSYADPRIVEIVQNRLEQLPPPIDKRKRGRYYLNSQWNSILAKKIFAWQRYR